MISTSLEKAQRASTDARLSSLFEPMSTVWRSWILPLSLGQGRVRNKIHGLQANRPDVRATAPTMPRLPSQAMTRASFHGSRVIRCTSKHRDHTVDSAAYCVLKLSLMTGSTASLASCELGWTTGPRSIPVLQPEEWQQYARKKRTLVPIHPWQHSLGCEGEPSPHVAELCMIDRRTQSLKEPL